MSDVFTRYDRIRLDVVTSSHGMPRNFLPDFLFHEFLVDRQIRFTQPFVDAWGGRRFDDLLLNHIKRRIDRNSSLSFPQCLVLILGTIIFKILILIILISIETFITI